MKTVGLVYGLVAGLLVPGCKAERSPASAKPAEAVVAKSSPTSSPPRDAATDGPAAEVDAQASEERAPEPTPAATPAVAPPVPAEAVAPAAATADPSNWDELELTPFPRKRACARVEPDEEAEVARADERIVCHNAGSPGAEIDEMTIAQAGTLEVRDGKSVLQNFDYDRVRSEGAAGSLYETFYLGATPRFVLHRCMADRRPTKRDDGYDLCGVRFPPDALAARKKG